MGILRDLIYAFIQSGSNSDTTAKMKERIDKFNTTMLAVLKCAYFAGILLIITALAQAFFTMYFPVADTENAIAIYVRNISSVIAFAAMGTFLITWCDFASEEEKINPRLLKSVRFTAILTAITSSVKGLHSLFIVLTQFRHGIMTTTYYATDCIAWIVLSLFAATYFRFALSKKSHKHSTVKYKTLTIATAAVCYLKVCLAMTYTLLKYNPHHFPWLYYLVSAIAWLLLAIFFSLYSSSRFILMPEKATVPLSSAEG